MAVEIHRGALALLAWIRSPATSQIIVHLLNFLVSFAGSKVYLSWCTYRYLDIAMKAHPIFWGSWMVTIIVILAILLSFHISQSDIWQISTLWYLKNFHTLIFDKFPHFDIWQISTLWWAVPCTWQPVIEIQAQSPLPDILHDMTERNVFLVTTETTI